MARAPLPADEHDRLSALLSYDILDTACEQTFDDLTRLAAHLTGSPIALVSLVDRDRQWFKSHFGLDASEGPRDSAFCAHAILGSEIMEVPDAAADPRFADNPLVLGAPDIRFYAGVPLVNPENRRLGTLCVIDRVPRKLDPVQREALATLARATMTTLELRRALVQMRELALSDPLTGLGNRRALLDELDRAIARQQRYGNMFALLYLDLDGMKRVNDTVGHAAGDEVLRAVGKALKSTMRFDEMAARLGGDEFAMVLAAPPNIDIVAAGERIRRAVSAAMAPRGWAITASVGAALFPTPPPDSQAALAVADQLMYRAKTTGKDRVVADVHRNLETTAP